MMQQLEPEKGENSQKKWIMLLIVLILFMLLLMSMRIWDALLLRRETKADRIPLVSVTTAELDHSKHEITLPGTILAWHQAPIFARTNGYIKEWYVDIGSKVKKGDLLARIETPELDAQLRQAEADLKVAIAENKLAQTTAQRWLNLRKSDSVSQQATDEKVDRAAATVATVASRQANRDRLQELVSFERVMAPFDGIISDRRTDIGALINIGSTPDQQKPLFRMVQMNPLRLYIKIPQAYSSRIAGKMQVQMQFAEHPGETFAGQLLNTANAIDPTSRTLLAQFEVDNSKGILLPGAYTQVDLLIPRFPQTLHLPINTLIFRKEGLQIASINKDNRVILKKISIHKDFGNYVEITSGIVAGERIVINPSDAIYSGQEVHIASVVPTKVQS